MLNNSGARQPPFGNVQGRLTHDMHVAIWVGYSLNFKTLSVLTLRTPDDEDANFDRAVLSIGGRPSRHSMVTKNAVVRRQHALR